MAIPLPANQDLTPMQLEQGVTFVSIFYTVGKQEHLRSRIACLSECAQLTG